MEKIMRIQLFCILVCLGILLTGCEENLDPVWHVVQTGTGSEYMLAYTEVQFLDEDHGKLLGNNINPAFSVIKYTNDGGNTWDTNEFQTLRFFGMHFVDINKGWIVGGNGRISNTEDGGDFWYSQDSGTSQSLNAVFFIDENTGWAAGNHGVILHTSNGGNTWSTQNSPVERSSVYLSGISFIDHDTGWIVGYDNHVDHAGSIILHTTDGGATWTSISGYNHYLNDVHFITDDIGWAVSHAHPGFPGVVLRTLNGAADWTAHATNINITMNSVCFTGGFHGWAVGGNANWTGAIIHTTNGGLDWDYQVQTTDYNLWDCYFTGLNNGWAVGERGLIMHYYPGP